VVCLAERNPAIWPKRREHHEGARYHSVPDALAGRDEADDAPTPVKTRPSPAQSDEDKKHLVSIGGLFSRHMISLNPPPHIQPKRKGGLRVAVFVCVVCPFVADYRCTIAKHEGLKLLHLRHSQETWQCRIRTVSRHRETGC
jgi:hypothetical protein